MPRGGHEPQSYKQESPTIVEFGVVREHPRDRSDHPKMNEKDRHAKGAFLRALSRKILGEVIDEAAHGLGLLTLVSKF